MKFTQEESEMMLQCLEFAKFTGEPSDNELKLIDSLEGKILLSKPKTDE